MPRSSSSASASARMSRVAGESGACPPIQSPVANASTWSACCRTGGRPALGHLGERRLGRRLIAALRIDPVQHEEAFGLAPRPALPGHPDHAQGLPGRGHVQRGRRERDQDHVGDDQRRGQGRQEQGRQVQDDQTAGAGQLAGARRPAGRAVAVDRGQSLHLHRQSARGRPRGRAALGIEIEQADVAAPHGKRAREIDRERGLADPALQVAACDDLAHGANLGSARQHLVKAGAGRARCASGNLVDPQRRGERERRTGRRPARRCGRGGRGRACGGRQRRRRRARRVARARGARALDERSRRRRHDDRRQSRRRGRTRSTSAWSRRPASTRPRIPWSKVATTSCSAGPRCWSGAICSGRCRSRCRARRPASGWPIAATPACPGRTCALRRSRSPGAVCRSPGTRRCGSPPARAISPTSMPPGRSICRMACRPRPRSTASSPICRSAGLPTRFERLAEAGPEDLCTGELARLLVRDIQAVGGMLDLGGPRPLPGAWRRTAAHRARRRDLRHAGRTHRRADALPAPSR